MSLRKLYSYLPVILAILISINFFWILPLVPGFDTPFYLTEIRRFTYSLPGPLSYLYSDRYLTIAIPAIIMKIFTLSSVLAYRISITTIYALIAFVIYRLMFNITKRNNLAALLSSGMVVSPFLIIYSSSLYANFAGLLIIFSFFAIESSDNFRFKNYILGLIFGLIFYTHNFTSVSFGLILVAYYLLKSYFYKDFSILKNAIAIIVVAFIVGIFSLSKYIPTKVSTAHASQISDSVTSFVRKINLPNQPVLLGDEKERVISSFKDSMGKYWLYFFPIFATYSFVTRNKEIRKEKCKFILPLALLTPSLFFSLQPFIGSNWLPERFVTYVSLSTIFFYISLITLPSYKKIAVFLAAIPLLLNYVDTDSLLMNKGYRAYSKDELSAYEYISENIDANSSIVLLSSNHYYWAQYMLESYILQSGDHFISCERIKNNPGYNEINYSVAKIFGSKDLIDTEKYFQVVNKAFPTKTIIFLVDNSLGCSNGGTIKNLNGAKEIFNQNNWHLYEID